jgi:hypothetical protein
MPRHSNFYGYIRVKRPDLTENRGGMIAEHRAVWIDYYGVIPEGVVVHHKNGDKSDNRIENLELFDGNGIYRHECHADYFWLDSDRPILKPFTEKDMIFIRDHLPIDRVLNGYSVEVGI